MKKRNMKKGFTLVELVIVIAVIAILAGVLIPTFGGIIDKANASAVQQEAATIWKEIYAIDLSDGTIDAKDNGKAIKYEGYVVADIEGENDGITIKKYEEVEDEDEGVVIVTMEYIVDENGFVSFKYDNNKFTAEYTKADAKWVTTKNSAVQ